MKNNQSNNENVRKQFPIHLVDYTPVLTAVRLESSTLCGKSLRGCTKIDVGTIDAIISTLLVTPLVIGHWRGTWMLADYYSIAWWACFLTGSLLHFIFTLLKDFLQDYFNQKKEERLLLSPVIFFLLSRGYTWVFGIACISHWRGAWVMVDEYTSRDIGPLVAVTLISLAILSATKTLRNINTSPFCINVDGLEPGFTFPTMFQTSVSILKTGSSSFRGQIMQT
jgi:hypothetical protein